MKKILFILAAGIAVMSCNSSDKTSENSNNAASTATSVTAVQPTTPVATTNQSSQVDSTKLTRIQWLDGTEKDFGKMKEGETLNVSFKFKNVGDKPLVISQVTAGCGCTIPEQPTKPYAPGETGEIKASFNSSGKVGANSKPVNVFANIDPAMTTLMFKVEVKAKS